MHGASVRNVTVIICLLAIIGAVPVATQRDGGTTNHR
jgi:hypothetical protein